MDNIKKIELLMDKANITYEESKEILENCDWNILDAVIMLEDLNKIKKPDVSIYYTNEENTKYKCNEKQESIINTNISKKRNIFELLCEFIDKCNNIFLEIKKDTKVMVKLPLTVIIVIIFFAFYIIIPLVIAAYFFDIDFSLSGRNIESSKVSMLLKSINKEIKKIVKSLKKGSKKND